MMLLVLLAVGGAGAAAAAFGGSRGGRMERLGAIAGVLALVVVLVLALALTAPQVVADGVPSAAGVFGGRLVPTNYLRLVIALWALDSVLVVGIAWLLGGLPALRGLIAGTLVAIVAGTVTLGATDLAMGVMAAAGAGLAALVVVLAADRGSAIPAGARELRVALTAGALQLGVVAVAPVAAALVLAATSARTGGETAPVPGQGAGEAGAVIGLASLAVALAVAIRFGGIPFHLRVPRLTDVAPPIAAPLLLAWLPLPVAAVGLATVDRLVAPLALGLEGEHALVVAVVLLTLTGAAVAAFLQEDVRHSVGYLVIADGGIVLLGLAALDPAAWGPTRIWLVALAASKTALGAWAAVMETRFGTRSVPDLRGWIRRAPLLAAALVLTIVATFGVPGWVVFAARGDLAALAAGAPWDAILVLAGFLTLPAYLRILAVGVGPVSSRVSGAVPERITWRRRRAESLPVEAEGSDGSSGSSGSDAPGAPAAPAEGARRRPAAATSAIGRGFAAALRRDRAELTSAAVLALAVLAALTSWGALDIGRAAAEPAPIVAGESAD